MSFSRRNKFFASKRFIAFLVILLILLALPVAILLVHHQTSSEQHAKKTNGHLSTVSKHGNQAATNGHLYFVSKHGNNADGKSWRTAWDELNQINWSVIRPGDTILLDGGSSQMVYTTTLTIGASGTQIAPITIARATESGHNGQVIIDGGRNAPLPYCGQPANTYQSNKPVLSDGISFDINSYVVVDGMSWHGIVVRNAGWQGGVIFKSYYPIPSPRAQLPYAHDDTLRNMEIYNNGTTQTYTTPGTLATAGFGVTPSGRNLTFEYMDIHDNGDDSFYSGGPIDGMVVRYSWLHNARAYPGHPGTSYDLCVHTEPLQISSTYGTSSPVTLENDIFGPGISNGVINSPGAYANNLTLRNVLVLDGGSHEIFPDSPGVQQWTIDHVTSFGQAGNLELAGRNHTVTNSIFYDGHVQTVNYNPGGPLDGVNSVTTASNNCQWHTDNNPSFINAKVADPQFVTDLSSYPPYLNIDDPPIYATDSWPTLGFLSAADFSLKPGSPCAGMGSAITSISQFLSIVNNQHPTPTPTVPTGNTPTPQ